MDGFRNQTLHGFAPVAEPSPASGAAAACLAAASLAATATGLTAALVALTMTAPAAALAYGEDRNQMSTRGDPEMRHHANVHLAEDCFTVSGPKSGEKCIFPFRYNGALHHRCTKDNHDKLWCATDTNQNDGYVDGQWGNCGLCNSGLGGHNQGHNLEFVWADGTTWRAPWESAGGLGIEEAPGGSGPVTDSNHACTMQISGGMGFR